MDGRFALPILVEPYSEPKTLFNKVFIYAFGTLLQVSGNNIEQKQGPKRPKMFFSVHGNILSSLIRKIDQLTVKKSFVAFICQWEIH